MSADMLNRCLKLLKINLSTTTILLALRGAYSAPPPNPQLHELAFRVLFCCQASIILVRLPSFLYY